MSRSVRIGRFFLICAVALGIAPGTLVRSDLKPDSGTLPVTITSLRFDERFHGDLEVTGAWHLTAPHAAFGGFSTLILSDNDRLLSATDRGWLLNLQLAEGAPVKTGARLEDFAKRTPKLRTLRDLEAMASDPVSGTVWTAYENANVLQRLAPGGRAERRAPPEIQNWSANSGPESLVRRDNGSFLVLGEGSVATAQRDRPALLFADDPIADTKPISFRLKTPPRFAPVDATALPDGSVLVLLRRLQIELPPRFTSAILQIDPDEIAEGDILSGTILAYLEAPELSENFEGIAYAPSANDDDVGAIYLISDDNFSLFQRTLIMRLAWPPAHQREP